MRFSADEVKSTADEWGPVTVASVQAWLRTLLEDIVTAPGIGTGVRRDLLTGALAPLGAAEAGRAAGEIESHAYWVRCDNHATGEDRALAASVDQAAYLASRALNDANERAAADGDGW